MWDEINEYVKTCGGDPSKHVYGNTRRQEAVVKVESAVRARECDMRELRDLLQLVVEGHDVLADRSWLRRAKAALGARAGRARIEE